MNASGQKPLSAWEYAFSAEGRVKGMIRLLVLIFVWYGLQGFGVIGKETDKCGRYIIALNAQARIVSAAIVEPTETVLDDYFYVLSEAIYCASNSSNNKAGYKYLVKENWFGEDYQIRVYKKWKWVTLLLEAFKEVKWIQTNEKTNTVG